MPSLALAALLVLIALLGGIGITAVGPGGIFVTISLAALTSLSAAQVAGTASATFIATGLIGAAAYLRSGQFVSAPAREAALLLSVGGVAGALLGTRLNLWVPEFVFAVTLAVFVSAIGLLIIYRQAAGLPPAATQTGVLVLAAHYRWTALLNIGLGIGLAGGMLGVGGPVLAVPLLVVCGVPMLIALAVAQVQSVFIAAFATAGYLSVSAVSWPIALLVGVPQVIGVVIGWRVAHRINADRLRIALGVLLIAAAPLIVL